MDNKNNNIRNARMANMELLRIISMMLVIVLHFLGKGIGISNAASSEMTAYGYVSWLIEAFAIVAVNVYMLISGYFLLESTFKVKRLLTLLLQLWFYSIGIGLVAAAFGYLPQEGFSLYYLAQLLLPVSTNHYWFMTAYIFMYLLMPLLSVGVRNMTKKQFQIVLCLLIFTFSIIKSVCPVPLATDMQGYDVIWYLCVFLVAAYIRMYGFSFFKNWKRSLFVYVFMALMIFGTTFLLRAFFLKTGKLEDMITVSYQYNHIFVLIASVALFYLFTFVTIKHNLWEKLIFKIAPYTLGVYLLHEHTAIRYEWPEFIFKITGIPNGMISWLLSLILSVILVFTAGILVDMLRSQLFCWINSLLSHFTIYRKLIDWLTGLSIVSKKEEKL
ncbi:MAG TPA: acyltransferase [Lachnospiraceae bacterium]|nr:acyltransferase [Lachnospiraceae bacterium]